MKQIRPVSIRTLPERLDRSGLIAFYQDVEGCLNVDRPAVVLDCSRLRVLNRTATQAMLCCLEEAMKRNGDVRVAALRAELSRVMYSTGLDSIFEMFDTVGGAVESFRRPNLSTNPRMQVVPDEPRSEMNAA